ncbi:MAG: hypothetical protein HC913_09925 [Microscillaceae bacterium]|nr:hypothetical protein [Microscillaceae bacterium]
MNRWASFGQRKQYFLADNSALKLNLAQQQRRKALLPLLTWVILGALLIVLFLNWCLFGLLIRFWVGLGALPFLVLSLWLYARGYDRSGAILLNLVVSSTILLAN